MTRPTDFPPDAPKVGLFVTCLVDLFRPNVGFAAVKLLEAAGAMVVVPRAQTCCGQPAYNSGDNSHARRVARGVIEAFEDVDYLVAPSGSCAGMIREHYPALFEDEPELHLKASALAKRSYELVSFLTDIMEMPLDRIEARFDGTVTYHDSCSGLRELDIKQQPRALLSAVEGIRLDELPSAEICCGFGGTFCVKYPDISNKMVGDKAEDIVATGADALLAGDMGCLMNMAGKLTRMDASVRVYHVAEVLAGMANGPGIGRAEAEGARALDAAGTVPADGKGR
ncbi:(Fe-S)-binding protein [Marivibrio halodurans]|uniref:(Fe-S)-binding protein n=1 Tax=Marivibrio halodurans TaxID=2039722 RepID=A0A8J7S9Y6_9PROT|nr:(Fe-S)-binding protein [Marivibrio halodurans]MBP5858172.1 (Fe-S)-binding protein [Marivibrio halodurans]